jgi:tRNA-dihydrouridine synthase
MLKDREDETHALHKIRTFAGWYTHGVPGGRALRQRIGSLSSAAEFISAVEECFDRSRAA